MMAYNICGVFQITLEGFIPVVAIQAVIPPVVYLVVSRVSLVETPRVPQGLTVSRVCALVGAITRVARPSVTAPPATTLYLIQELVWVRTRYIYYIIYYTFCIQSPVNM